MIAIIDYGVGNLRSVYKAFETVAGPLGVPVDIVDQPTDLTSWRAVVLPGQGAFGDSVNNLRAQGLERPLLDAVEAGMPLLGICVGMQLLFDESEEMGQHEGLHIIPGSVRRFPAAMPDAAGTDGRTLRIPQKTFSTPHGGGGPGSGPICVTRELEPFLPIPRVAATDGKYQLREDYPQTVGKIHTFYGNFGILVRAYSYIRSMGADLKKVSQLAVLNANYIKESLRDVYQLAYDRRCMHECVFTDALQKEHKIETLDIAKRLMEYGFHPPTVYFPLVVQGAIMVEPTETESKESIDAFIAAMRAIAQEAKETPEVLQQAPRITKVRRLDETAAARKPCLKG